MIPYNPNRLFVPLADDFTTRLSQQPRHAIGNANPGMVAQPYADPGYGMPVPDMGNLNQAPGLEIPGTLPASYQAPADTDSLWVQTLKRLVNPYVDPRAETVPPRANTDPGLNRQEPRIGDVYPASGWQFDPAEAQAALDAMKRT